jgi:hypothetical protein
LSGSRNLKKLSGDIVSEDRQVLSQEIFNLDHAPQGSCGTPRFIVIECLSGQAEVVNDQLEPEFVRLMHHDEEELIRRAGRQGLLQL